MVMLRSQPTVVHSRQHSHTGNPHQKFPHRLKHSSITVEANAPVVILIFLPITAEYQKVDKC